ncbi:pancreatic triacylglycerol lipase-like [Nasonia vitripennis]|uniref:phospholipase A1 n=1 Tax=Nasonia vitripennis TaxID=7425 RepID=A0A7M7Q3W2_NASVI|nr:pancreatic triacylglycerol lipase-like [Nasonia vitripennis]
MTTLWSFYYVVFALIAIGHQAEATSFFCKNLSEKFISKFYPGVNPNNIQYYFYAKGNNANVHQQYKESNEIQTKFFNPDQKTILIVHGFVNDQSTAWVQDMIRNFLDKGNVNVIAIDWSIMFRRTLLNYRESAKKTEQVAASITRFFVKLAEVYDKDLSKWAYLHFMGHSLGAHVVGQAAEMLKPFVNIHRVTGFDPAKPYFDEGEGVRMRLDKSNAQFVDVIHTNSSPDEKTFGLYEPLGHIDFYPNGGNTQPCCTRNSKTIHDDEINKCVSYLVWGIDATGLFANFVSKIINKQDMVCDHRQGQDYFIQSMDGSSKYVACKKVSMQDKTNKKVKRCIEMGINASRYNGTSYHGSYYLDITNCNK